MSLKSETFFVYRVLRGVSASIVWNFDIERNLKGKIIISEVKTILEVTKYI